jgi:hypothetical protein
MGSVAANNEKRLAGTVRELAKAEGNLAKFERAFGAPKRTCDEPTEAEIAAAQKGSLEGSPRWRSLQKRFNGTRRQVKYYRNYIIHFYRKPAPDFGDWSFEHKDYDGAPDGPGTSCSDHRCGYAESPTEARAEIDAQYVDLELDEDGHYTRDGLTLQVRTHE